MPDAGILILRIPQLGKVVEIQVNNRTKIPPPKKRKKQFVVITTKS